VAESGLWKCSVALVCFARVYQCAGFPDCFRISQTSLSHTHTFRHRPLLLVPSKSYKQNKHNTHLNCNTILGWPPVSSTIPFQTSNSTKQSEDILTATQYSSDLQHQVSNKSPQKNQNTSRLQVNTRAAPSTRYDTNHIPSLFHTKS
jgi:hypothetical protein